MSGVEGAQSNGKNLIDSSVETILDISCAAVKRKDGMSGRVFDVATDGRLAV